MSRFFAYMVASTAAQWVLACSGGSQGSASATGGSPQGSSDSKPTGGMHALGGSGGVSVTSSASTDMLTSGGAGGVATSETHASGGSQVGLGGTSTRVTSSAAIGGDHATGGTEAGGGTRANTGGASAFSGTSGGIANIGGSGGVSGVASTGGTAANTTGGIVGTGGTTSCPSSTDYVGSSSWTYQLVVTSGAHYCGEQNEIRTLEQEFATKAKLTIAPGTYPLPEVAGTYDFALPVCFDLGRRGPAPTFAGAGSLKTTRYNIGTPYVNYAHEFNQPLTSPDSAIWSFNRYIGYWDLAGVTLIPPVLDGSVLVQMGDIGHGSILQLCEGDSCEEWNDITFADCDPPFKLYRHTVTFEGGEVVLDVRIDGAVGVSAMPAAFVAARGTLDGTAFTQDDYWKLVYSAPHHHFSRNFAVLFDMPIDGACGIKVTDLDPYDRRLPAVDTIECDLSNIAARAVSAATSELP